MTSRHSWGEEGCWCTSTRVTGHKHLNKTITIHRRPGKQAAWDIPKLKQGFRLVQYTLGGLAMCELIVTKYGHKNNSNTSHGYRIQQEHNNHARHHNSSSDTCHATGSILTVGGYDRVSLRTELTHLQPKNKEIIHKIFHWTKSATKFCWKVPGCMRATSKVK